MLIRAKTLATCALVALSCHANALEVVGTAPYLDTKVRAEWRAEPLEIVLKEIEGHIGQRINMSQGIKSICDSQLVTLVDLNRVPLRSTLELIERTQNVHIIAEQLVLNIETWEDFRDRKRHPVNLALRDYGLFVNAPDFPGPDLGFTAGGGGGVGFTLFTSVESHHSAGRGPAPDEVVELLHRISTDGNIELRGNGNAYLMITDEEEVAIRAALDDVRKRTLQQTRWRVTFGFAPDKVPLPTGFVAKEVASTLSDSLKTPQALLLSAFNGQRVNAMSGTQQAIIDDIEIVSGQFDPVQSIIKTGHAADLRPSVGSEFLRIQYKLSWVDPLPAVTTELLNPSHHLKGKTSTTVTTTKDENKNEKETSVNINSDEADIRTGVTVAITKPVFWTWMPRGDVLLTTDKALILATEHPTGTAVIIMESLP